MTRVAIVTGAGRGIGAAVARGLGAEGWAVICVDRGADDPRIPYPLATEGELARVVEAVGAGGGTAEVLMGDAADRATLEQAVALAEERFGGVDAVVAAAGVIAGGVPFWEMPLSEQDAVIEVDLLAVLTAARVGVPALLRRPEPRSGRFIAIASAAAVRGLPMLAAYCAAKAGVTGLVRALAVELRATGVTANAVSPGSTRTAILEESARLYGIDDSHHFGRQQPVDRLLDPAEIAAMVVWLAGERSSAVTGADLAVDGGLAV